MFLQYILQKHSFTHTAVHTLSPNHPTPCTSVFAPEAGGDRGIDVYGLTIKNNTKNIWAH